jgi:hypothetical protein
MWIILDPASIPAALASGSFEGVKAEDRRVPLLGFGIRITSIVSSAVIVVIANLSYVCGLSAGGPGSC